MTVTFPSVEYLERRLAEVANSGYDFIREPNNPLWARAVGETASGFGDVWFEPDDTRAGPDGTYYAVFGASSVGIRIQWSATGLPQSWTRPSPDDPIKEPGGGGAWDEDATIDVPSLFRVGDKWVLMYRVSQFPGGHEYEDKDVTGVSTCDVGDDITDPTVWVENPLNPILQPEAVDPLLWNYKGAECSTGGQVWLADDELWVCYVESGSGTGRKSGYYTCPGTTADPLVNFLDPAEWTPSAEPILSNGRFCASVSKIGVWWYFIVAHYTSTWQNGVTGTANKAELELWRSSSPYFPVGDRRLLGAILAPEHDDTKWDSANLDTAKFLCDDIERNSYNVTDGELWLYYSGIPATGTQYIQMGLARGYPAKDFRVQKPQQFPIGNWYSNAITAGMADEEMERATGPDDQGVVMIQSGSVTGLVVHHLPALVAGYIEVEVTKALAGGLYVATGLTCRIDMTTALKARWVAIKPGELVFQPGDRIGCIITTPGTLDPVGATVSVAVMAAYEG